jgi:hypothetical protein
MHPFYRPTPSRRDLLPFLLFAGLPLVLLITPLYHFSGIEGRRASSAAEEFGRTLCPNDFRGASCVSTSVQGGYVDCTLLCKNPVPVKCSGSLLVEGCRMGSSILTNP